MTVERQIDPLPVGCYWVDVFEKDFETFRSWLSYNDDSVRVVRTESFEGGWQAFENLPARDWYLFEVLKPVKWEGPGFPDIAPSKEMTSEDTVDRPDPPKGAIESLEETIIEAPKKAAAVVVAGFLGLGLYVLIKATSTGKGKKK